VRLRSVTLLLVLCPAVCVAGGPKTCVPPADAAQKLNKDICISVHIYDVVELSDGTRLLDVCPPSEPDAQCRFTIISLNEDRADVGELRRYRDQDVQIRGIVQPLHGRAALVLSHARQFRGGPPKFKANPLLLHGFTGEDDRTPIHDPNLRTQGGHGGFSDTRDVQPLPPTTGTQKPKQ
jgi:hypothetical protein